MGIFQRLLATICPIIVFLVGAWNLLLTFSSGAIRRWLSVYDLSHLPQTSQLWLNILLVTMPVFLLLLTIQGLMSRRVLVMRTENGQPLKIRESAVSRYIHDRLLTLSFVRSARVRSKSPGGALSLKIRVWVTSQEPLNNFQEKIINRVVKDSKNGFGVLKVLAPDIQFEEVSTKRKDLRAQAQMQESMEEPLLPSSDSPLYNPFTTELPMPSPDVVTDSREANPPEERPKA